MEKGKIPVYDRTVEAYWLPDTEECPWILSENGFKKRNGVPLSESALLEIPSVKAYLCRDCKKGVFEIP